MTLEILALMLIPIAFIFWEIIWRLDKKRLDRIQIEKQLDKFV